MSEEIVVQLVTCPSVLVASYYIYSSISRRTRAVLENKPDQLFRHNDFVEAGNMGVEELAVMMDLASQISVFLTRRLKHHLRVIWSGLSDT